MLLRPAYLGVANTFALLWLLPVDDRDKDVEIVALRHQIAVLQRQLGAQQVQFTPADRALLAALLHRLAAADTAGSAAAGTPRHDPALAMQLARPSARRRLASRGRGRPRILHSIRALVLRLAGENPS